MNESCFGHLLYVGFNCINAQSTTHETKVSSLCKPCGITSLFIQRICFCFSIAILPLASLSDLICCKWEWASAVPQRHLCFCVSLSLHVPSVNLQTGLSLLCTTHVPFCHTVHSLYVQLCGTLHERLHFKLLILPLRHILEANTVLHLSLHLSDNFSDYLLCKLQIFTVKQILKIILKVLTIRINNQPS